MTDAATADDEAPKTSSKLPLILGLVLALAGGGGGFFAVYSGMLFGHSEPAEMPKADEAKPDFAFVAIDPMIVSVGSARDGRHLRFQAQLEVAAGAEAEVEAQMPRIVDVLNGYLRAVGMSDLEDPAALIRLRTQMLRRIQIITGEGLVRDLLIREFVLN